MKVPDIDLIAVDENDTARLKAIVTDAECHDRDSDESVDGADSDEDTGEMLAPELIFPEIAED